MTALEERRLGGTEMRPNSIGLGAAWWGRHSSEQETIAAIHRAIDLGINFIDTYPGADEETWGKALAEVGRESVYLQAKVSRVSARRSDHSAASTRSSLEESLRALRTEYVDAVLIHGYDQRKDLDAEDMVDPLTEGNALDELLKMKAEGKVRHIGIGARSHKVLRRAIETGHIELVLTYLEYNLLTQAAAEDIFPVCRQHDVGVELASPLGMGLLTGTELRFEQEERMIPGKEPRAGAMLQWCRERDVEIRHLAMQFCLAAPIDSIVLPGPGTLRELEESYEAATVQVPPQIWEEFATEFGIGV